MTSSLIQNHAVCKAFWMETMDPFDIPLEANMSQADFLHGLRTGKYDDDVEGEVGHG